MNKYKEALDEIKNIVLDKIGFAIVHLRQQVIMATLLWLM